MLIPHLFQDEDEDGENDEGIFMQQVIHQPVRSREFFLVCDIQTY